MTATAGRKAKKKAEPVNPNFEALSVSGQARAQLTVDHVQMAQNEFDGSTHAFFKLGQILIDIDIRLRRVEEHLNMVLEDG